MCLPHYFQILTLYAIVGRFFPGPYQHVSRLQVGLFALLFQLFYHLSVYDRKRWARWVEEFKGETNEQRAKGRDLIFAYTAGTYILFFLTLIVLYL
jgi:hypothetical protein